METAFQDEIYALTPELLERMTTSKKLGGSVSSAMRDYDWPIHDRVGALQAGADFGSEPYDASTGYDNEFKFQPIRMPSRFRKFWIRLPVPSGVS